MAAEKRDPTFVERFVLPLLGIFVVSSLIAVLIIAGMMREPRAVRDYFVLHCAGSDGHWTCSAAPSRAWSLPVSAVSQRVASLQGLARGRAEYLFYCKDCDVLWKTGLQEGD